MVVVFFVLLAIVLILILPIKFKLNFSYNVFKNIGHIRIKLFNFKLFNYKLHFKNNKIVLSNFKTKKEIKLDINKQNIDYANEIQKQIRKRLYLKELICYFNFGINNNPFTSALISAGAEIGLSIISSLIKFQKPTANINYKISTYYTKDICTCNLIIELSISITNLLISLIKAKNIINKKELKQKYGRKAKASN